MNGPVTGGIGLVDGWRVGESAAYGWLLLNPDGFEVSPNMAPAKVRDAFRAFVDARTPKEVDDGEG